MTPPTYCISTSTSQVPVYYTNPLMIADEQGYPFYATTTCPAVVSTVNYVSDNPAQNMFNGLILFSIFFIFVVWYFLARFKLS